MPYASHRHGLTSVPRYGLPHAAQQRSERSATDTGMAHTFRSARSARKSPRPTVPGTTRDVQISRPSRTIWPAAFAVLFIANLMPPTESRLPRPTDLRDDSNGNGGSGHADGYPMAWPDAAPAPDDVAIQPLTSLSIKSNYSLSEFLDSLAASNQPFLRTSEALLDMHAEITGEPVPMDTRKSLSQWMQLLDAATGLIPAVGTTRMPGQAAGIVSDLMAGRAPDAERLVGWIQSADTRTFASRSIVRTQPNPLSSPNRVPLKPPGRSELSAPAQDPLLASPDEAAPPIEDVDNVRVVEIPVEIPVEIDAPTRLTTLPIENESENLQGYAQSIPSDELPPGPRERLILFEGRRYIAGEAGYYQATRGGSDDHWLVSSPPGSDSRALVPVHYDSTTGKWRAERPLRLCGGGCGPSREATPDSIGMDREKIASAVAHLPDESVREGIRFAFKDLSLLHLARSNRPDMTMVRDNSIIEHRAALRTSMKRIKRNAPLIKQQEAASLITAVHYYWNHYAEAFCQENAEILFHYLIANSIPTSRIRMITVQPRGRAPHVMVLYTESERLISMLESSTPSSALNLEPDGIGDSDFAREIYEARETTVLLDPWSRTRVTSFHRDNHAADLVDTLDGALAEIGHQPGNPYQVSITRPLNTRRGSAMSVASAGSSGSGGSGSGGSNRASSVQKLGTNDEGRSGSAGGASVDAQRPDV